MLTTRKYCRCRGDQRIPTGGGDPASTSTQKHDPSGGVSTRKKEAGKTILAETGSGSVGIWKGDSLDGEEHIKILSSRRGNPLRPPHNHRPHLKIAQQIKSAPTLYKRPSARLLRLYPRRRRWQFCRSLAIEKKPPIGLGPQIFTNSLPKHLNTGFVTTTLLLPIKRPDSPASQRCQQKALDHRGIPHVAPPHSAVDPPPHTAQPRNNKTLPLQIRHHPNSIPHTQTSHPSSVRLFQYGFSFSFWPRHD